MPEEANGQLREDKPLEAVDRDRLGYAGFAKNLAETITARTPTSGYTIGVYGPWGSGKSTILNFVEQELSATDPAPTVVRFNPWWFSGRGDLIEKFLGEVAAQLKSNGDYADIRESLADLSSTLADIPFGAVTGIPADKGFEALRGALNQDPTSVDTLKQDIETELEEIDQKIVVIIDDLDRLSPSEITQMFQLVQSIADFPNVVYLLAFEKGIIVDALQQEGNFRDGKRYLEKIVQLPLHIPKHKSGALEAIFIDQIETIRGTRPPMTERWERLLNQGILPLLETPREVVRLVNAIEVVYASIGEDTNFTDLAGLETLRVFHEDVYNAIKLSPGQFVGSPGEPHNVNKESYSYLLDPLENPTPVNQILSTLFPLAEDILHVHPEPPDWAQMRADKRICHEAWLPTYFRLSVPDGAVSSTEMNIILQNVDDNEYLRTVFIRGTKDSQEESAANPQLIIERLCGEIDKISPDAYSSILEAVFAEAERIARTSDRSVRKNYQNMETLIDEICGGSPTYPEILANCIKSGSSPHLAVYALNTYLRPEGEEIPAEVVDMQVNIGSLKQATVMAIKDTVDNDELTLTPRLNEILDAWATWGTSSEPKAWVEAAIGSKFTLLEFIDRMSEVDITDGSETVYLDPEEVYRWIDRERIDNKLSRDPGAVTDKESSILERYERATDMLDAGLDPADPANWRASS
ncbi:KAP family P-loop NTPase fold protein [Halosegnis longus]|uniref:KAP family P-loop NTPase fold protein n=1 Tax=Halosegnis longus TaxID=2216012 RepID=UPI001561BBE7|nr:KAP family NTPase [Halosegnis longus]